MKDRIEIDGVWYTREDSTSPKVKPQLEPSISIEGLVFESDLYCFEATRIRDDAGEFYHKDCTIKFTDKSIKIIDGEGSRDESWDNTEWMNEFLNNNPEALEEAVKSLCSQGLVELKEVLNELAVKGWI